MEPYKEPWMKRFQWYVQVKKPNLVLFRTILSWECIYTMLCFFTGQEEMLHQQDTVHTPLLKAYSHTHYDHSLTLNARTHTSTESLRSLTHSHTHYDHTLTLHAHTHYDHTLTLHAHTHAHTHTYWSPMCKIRLLLYLHTCVKALVLLCPMVEVFNMTNTLLARRLRRSDVWVCVCARVCVCVCVRIYKPDRMLQACCMSVRHEMRFSSESTSENLDISTRG